VIDADIEDGHLTRPFRAVSRLKDNVNHDSLTHCPCLAAGVQMTWLITAQLVQVIELRIKEHKERVAGCSGAQAQSTTSCKFAGSRPILMISRRKPSMTGRRSK
jgi:hypothetical protein